MQCHNKLLMSILDVVIDFLSQDYISLRNCFIDTVNEDDEEI